MRLRALLDTEGLGLRLLGGEHELDRPVRGVMTTDLRNPGRYLTGGELVLTGLVWRRDSADSEPFVRILANAGVAGLAVGEADLSGIPDDLVAACAHHRLPLFAVNTAVSFAAITEHVVRQVSGERAGDLAAVVDRHRRLMTSGPAGGGPDAVLDLLGSDLDLRAWVLSPTGRRIAGSDAPLDPDRAARIAAAHLAVARTGRRGPYRVVLGATTYALFPVRDPAGGPGAAPHRALEPREAALSEWLLCVQADAGDWPAERLDLLQGVTQLIAVERDRRDAARAVRRRLAQEILELVQATAPPAEIAARLRVAAPVLLPGGGAAPSWQIVVASLEWSGPRAAAGSAATVQSVLEEALATPAAPAGRGTDRIAVAHVADEAIALVPVERGEADDAGREGAGDASGTARGGGGAGDEHTGATGTASAVGAAGAAGAASAAGAAGAAGAREPAGQPARGPGLYADEIVAAVREPLSAGLGEDGRLALGVSAVVDSAEGLRGALEEARHARRVAAARQGRVCAAGHHELASHVLLLPFVPDDVRRAFTARLLDPLRDYDQRHRAELIPTLDAFLDCDGSWTRCASRLHLHVNTLRYRIGRIEQLTGRDLARLEDKLDFYLALRMS
ncbi:PucR family transcriptional regulator ligand-binding domain-containing protein [Streptomyces montanisoli]|uniref:PucR family transcriptional regulator ligand-binding domain-containing protein n=1 Tax=Streptomyces montanisoli TaxID=2798581 RepID=A0A940MBS7_9ACTN|nr:PucR family transcriptional regulator ligand-binding domain-containing protein [Streptomyces montanisoli]MBP0460049.1 PucR family transcriptional regulator ligand-binding domain-containing protein [Streptomyces montanisoli]